MEYVETLHIKGLKEQLSALTLNSEDANTLGLLDTEIPKVLEIVDIFKKAK